MKRVGIACLCLLSLTGCVTISGQLEVDWQGDGEMGVAVLFPASIFERVDNWLPSLERAIEERGYRIEHIRSGREGGFRVYQSLDEFQQTASATTAKPSSEKDDFGKQLADWLFDHFTIGTSDTFFYRDVTIDGELDFRQWPLLSIPLFHMVSPELEFTLPIIPEHNADEVVGDRTLRWHLSWDESNPIYLHIRIWKITRLIGVGVGFVLVISLLWLCWSTINKRTSHI